MLAKKIDYSLNSYLSLNDTLNKYNTIYACPKIKYIKIQIKTDKCINLWSKSISEKNIYFLIIFLFYYITSVFPFINVYNLKFKEKNKLNTYNIHNILNGNNNLILFIESLFLDVLKNTTYTFKKINVSLFLLKIPIFLIKEIEFLSNLEFFNSLLKNFDIDFFFYINNNKKHIYNNIYKMIPYFWYIK